MTQALLSPFDHVTGPSSDPLVAAAAALTSGAVENVAGALVIVLHPHTSRHQVLAGGGHGTLRAAVSAAASGHDRLWSDVPSTPTTTEVAVRTLPEVLRAAAEASGISSVHIGRLDNQRGVACVVLWFETSDGVASLADRETALALLSAAAEKSGPIEAPRPTNGNPTVIDVDEPTDITRVFDPSDPDLDSVTGVPHAERFDALIAAHEGDEATLLVVDLDDFETVAPELTDTVLRTIADRLVASTRGTDVVGCVGPHSFGVLFGSIERTEAFHVAKRLAGVVKQPIDSISLTATIALAHQSGLVDMNELRESADEAIASGKRSGRGRLVMAA